MGPPSPVKHCARSAAVGRRLKPAARNEFMPSTGNEKFNGQHETEVSIKAQKYY